MLVKEYRIPLPLTVEEYRIAQLYMIAKKSREESKGEGSGVEILLNEPYTDGPGGSGQYTKKIYHIASYLPGWLKSLLPKTGLTAEEEAWNSYPYTKTRYTCSLVQKFHVEIETYYCGDAGHQENIFKLTGSDLRNRIVDLIDVVNDQLHGADYSKDEDPRYYISNKTRRGPLDENWIEGIWRECEGKQMPLPNGKAIMCAYKLCRVEFQYWGMQSKIEKFIHDVALRKTMLRAHRQAWAWQDEWFGLTMEDIRRIEKQTQEALKRKMAGTSGGSEDEEEEDEEGQEDNSEKTREPSKLTSSSSESDTEFLSVQSRVSKSHKIDSQAHEMDHTKSSPISIKVTQQSQDHGMGPVAATSQPHKIKSGARTGSKGSVNSPGSNTSRSFDLLASIRMEGIVRNDSDTGDSEEEFFDCVGGDDTVSLTKWSSLELIPQEASSNASKMSSQGDSIFSMEFINRAAKERERCHKMLPTRSSVETPMPDSPTMFGGGTQGACANSCDITVLCLVIHSGSALDPTMDLTAKKSDINTFKSMFDSVIRQHYSAMIGRVAIKLVPCPAICKEALGVLSSLSPYSFDVYGGGDSPSMTNESVPIGAIPILSTSQTEYNEAVLKVVNISNQVYQSFIKSEDGHGFNGQIVFIGDSIGSILAYDVLVSHSSSGHSSDEDPPSPSRSSDNDHLKVSCPNRRRSSSSVSDSGHAKLEFDVNDFFMFGSPLGLVLAHRKTHSGDRQTPVLRPCQQVYNLFHPTDPLATRLEPLLSARFAAVPPVNVAQYNKYPLGDGQPFHILECIQCHPHLFADSSGLNVSTLTPNCIRRSSDISVQSNMSGAIESLPLQAINQLTQKWWGNKRVDFALYCPEALSAFPVHSLPHLFHASYWESQDAISFILRQIGAQDSSALLSHEEKDLACFTPVEPREKWIKKRTSVKLKNVAANHRGNDVIVTENCRQVFRARFMYGPLDMVALTGEKVDIYVMKDPPGGEWIQIATEVTDKNGRVVYTVPQEKAYGYGIYPIKMVVRGDHTSADFYCAVLPPKTECVVFSIDGSFTASVSVTGRDPRVRAGAVDVVRHWQELGYLILYVTARPDMQQRRVVSWLAQHNFPHGLVFFSDGFTKDFLAHKTEFLKSLVNDHKLIVHAAYGSNKDINVYHNVGLSPDNVFIVGKVSKKMQHLATILNEGYSSHLNALQSHGGSRPARGNARMVIPRNYFGLPGQPGSARRRRSAKRTTSYPVMSSTEVASPTPPLTSSSTRVSSPRKPKPSLSAVSN